MKQDNALPRVVRLYLISALNGFGAALGFVALILVFNVANLRHLVETSDVGVVAVVAFWILNGIVFSGVQFAFALGQAVRRDTPSDDTD